jgi:hypothetical protein
MRTYEAQALKVGTKVQVKTSSGTWVSATVVEEASSKNRRRPVVLLASGQTWRDIVAENIRSCPTEKN